MGKKIAIAAAAGFAALILLLLVVPAAMDWDGYKGEIAARLEESLGRPVEIAGPVQLRLLPSPEATVRGVGIGNLAGAEPADMATIPALKLRLGLLPLLTGRVDVAVLVLDHPEIHLQRLADGRPNWRFTPAAKAAAPAVPAVPAERTASPPAEPAAFGGAVHLGAVEIADGIVTYDLGGGGAVRLDGIDGRLVVDSPAGPFAATASARWHGLALALDAHLDRSSPGQTTPLSLTLALPAAGARLALAGSVGAENRDSGSGPAVTGRLTLSAPSPAALSAALGGPASLPLPGPLAGEAKLAADAAAVTLSDLVLTAGPLRADGSIAAAFARRPRVDVVLNVPSFDLDALAAAPPAPGPAQPAATAPPAAVATTPSPAPAAGSPAAAAPAFTLPANLFVDTQLTVGTLPWHGQVARQGRLEATLDQGELVVEHAGLLLPGGTAVSVDGTLAARDGKPDFSGHLDIQAADLRQGLAWLGLDTAAIPADRLHRFVLSAALAAAPGQLALDHVALGLDSLAATGSATLRIAGARPAVAVTLAADTVDLDAYLPPSPPPPPPALPAVAATAPAGPPAAAAPAAGGGAKLPGVDGSFDLQVRRLIYRRIPADDVAVAATLADGSVTLGHAQATIAGSALTAAGTLSGLGQGQPRLDGLDLQLASPDPGRLARAVGAGPATALDRIGALDAGASLSGGIDSLDAKLHASAGGVALTADGTIADPLAAPRYKLQVGVQADNAALAIRLLSPGYRPGAALGRLALAAQVAGDGRAVDVSNLDLKLGEVRVTGTAQANLTGRRPMVTASLAAGVIDLDPFFTPRRGGSLPPPAPAGLHGGGPRPPAAAIVPVALGGRAGGGGSPFSREPLDLAVLQAFDGVVDLKAEALSWQGWRLDGALAHLVLDNGTATLDKLAGKLLGGSLALTLRLSGGSLPQLTGAVAVTGADIGHSGLGGAAIQLTQGRMDADARFAAAGRSSADMAARLGGDGKVAVHDGILAGFDLPAVNRQMSNLQNIGSLLGLAQAGLSGGSTPFSALTASFHADNGVVVTRDARLDAEGGTATAVATIDLPRWTVASTIDIRVANGAAPPLSLRIEGPLDNPRKIVDINALQHYLAERGLGTAFKGKGATPLEGLLGALGGKAQPPSPDGEAQPPVPSGKQMLRNLLKGLGGQ